MGLAGAGGVGESRWEGEAGSKAGGWPRVCCVTRDVVPCPALA